MEGNFIGTDISGANSVPNSSEGIHLIGGSFNTIGGTTSGSGNIISGNKGSGIEIEFTYDNLIEGNLIGIQFDAISPLGNSLSGINIILGSSTLATCLGNSIFAIPLIIMDSLGINLDGGNENAYDVTANEILMEILVRTIFKTIQFLPMLKLILEHL